MFSSRVYWYLLLCLFFFHCISLVKKDIKTQVVRQIERCIQDNARSPYHNLIPARTQIDSIEVSKLDRKLDVFLSKEFGIQPFRPGSCDSIHTLFRSYLGKKFKGYQLKFYCLGYPIEELIPNFYRSDSSFWDKHRMPQSPCLAVTPLSINLDKTSWQPTTGLWGNHIAVWPSHGWYYAYGMQRWEWQRPRLFTTVEDMLPYSFVMPYLLPMLENAGAVALTPRERDFQTREVVVDNDTLGRSGDSCLYRESPLYLWKTAAEPGFAVGYPPYPANFNPFDQGTVRYCVSDTVATAVAEWIPCFDQAGEYSVYISYYHSPENVQDAHYTVYHTGGSTRFSVNQQMSGRTWIYLGKFRFNAGRNPEIGRVVLSNQSRTPGRIVSADALRFGGGMGTIIRDGHVSGLPRYAEGARYYLQYSGMPDSLVYNLNKNQNDYNDDYQSRPEWVNYLKGAPWGPNTNRNILGLNVPIDLCMAFHTDAGIDTSDGVIGTLMIYSLEDFNKHSSFPDGMSRIANRDMGDLIQTQIVQDINGLYDFKWQRRQLLNGDYSECVRPNVPSCLLELLSHQNFRDMQFALNPRFRFEVARSIYKGMLRFLATQAQRNYVVQPLPVSHLQSSFIEPRHVTLKWKPVLDPLEVSAQPDRYVVYIQKGEYAGFDNGTLVHQPGITIKNLTPGVIYSFKITALNDGGESFPSEIISVCQNADSGPPILIVNGFDRVEGPYAVSAPGLKGFWHLMDDGVADQSILNFTGPQYDFSPSSLFKNNDSPGHGASMSQNENQVIAGNMANYGLVHGSAISKAGYSFVTCSDEAVMDGMIDLKPYRIMDLILGLEKQIQTPVQPKPANQFLAINANYQAFPPKLQNVIRSFLEDKKGLLVSGAFIGSDLWKNNSKEDIQFAKDVLKMEWVTHHAAGRGEVISVDTTFFPNRYPIRFNTDYCDTLYAVKSPDTIQPAGGGKILLRYQENRFSAGISYQGSYSTVILGFPFESIGDSETRDRLMEAVIKQLINFSTQN